MINDNTGESRREYLLKQFEKAVKESQNVANYQFWSHDNKPIELWGNKVIQEKIDYIHNNPLQAGLVFRSEDYVYSSAVDYSGEEGLLKDITVLNF